jgi:peptide/nickel transport system permease protein
VVLLTVAVVDYGSLRVLRPDLYEGEHVVSGTAHDVGRAFLHLDLGRACSFGGCPEIHDILARGIPADLYLLAGGLLIGLAAGVAGGVWCATRPRTASARALEGVAALAYSTPVYVVGFGLLILFEPSFGLVHAPLFFHPTDYRPPTEDPWGFLQGILVPWLVLALPLGAVFLRLTRAMAADTLGEPYIVTARAKGVSELRIGARHASPPALVANASLMGAWAPWVVTNLVLVEYALEVPGTFVHYRRALNRLPVEPHVFDYPLAQALALWGAVLVVVLGLLGDGLLYLLDPLARRAPGE